MGDFQFFGFCCYVCLLFGFCWSELEETGSLPETSSERQCPVVVKVRGFSRGLLSNFLPDPLRGLGLGLQRNHIYYYYYSGWVFWFFWFFLWPGPVFFLGFFCLQWTRGLGWVVELGILVIIFIVIIIT